MAESFTVIKQQQTVGRLPDDTYGPVVRVTFRTTAGTVLAIDIPHTDYTEANVKAAIEARVAEADAIQNL